jgi:hypothetical protein
MYSVVDEQLTSLKKHKLAKITDKHLNINLLYLFLRIECV